MKKRIIVVLLVQLLLMLFVAGCNKEAEKVSKPGEMESGEEKVSKEDKTKEPVTLTVYSQLSGYSGLQAGWSAQVLLDKFNVKLNIVPDSDGMYENCMEEDFLGDIIIWGSDGEQYQQAVEDGQLLDWEENDLLTTHGGYMKENLFYALEKNRKLSGDGKIHGFGHGVATSYKDCQPCFYTWDVRWDLYKELGYPTVYDLNDIIELCIDMKEICPTDENGNPTYAVSLWSDWDENMMFCAKSMVSAFYGYDGLGIGFYNPSDGMYYDCLKEDGPYLEVLEFYHRLYQNHLLAPDLQKTDYDAAFEKIVAGNNFFSIFDYSGQLAYNTEEHMDVGKAMQPLVPDKATPLVYGMSVGGGNRIWSIGANSKYPELCMEIINYFATPEGTMTMRYGPQGLIWDYDEDGHTYFTELGKKCIMNPATELTGDEQYQGIYGDGHLQINNIVWAVDAENPDSNGETYHHDTWKNEHKEASCMAEQDWRDFHNVGTMYEYFKQCSCRLAPASDYMEPEKGKKLSKIWKKVTACIINYSWKAVYAESEEDYDRIVTEMIQKAKEYGYDECVEWSKAEAAARKAAEDEVMEQFSK